MTPVANSPLILFARPMTAHGEMELITLCLISPLCQTSFHTILTLHESALEKESHLAAMEFTKPSESMSDVMSKVFARTIIKTAILQGTFVWIGDCIIRYCFVIHTRDCRSKKWDMAIRDILLTTFLAQRFNSSLSARDL